MSGARHDDDEDDGKFYAIAGTLDYGLHTHHKTYLAQSAGGVEYTDCVSEEE